MSDSESLLLLPGDPGFDDILGRTLPCDWEAVAAQNSGEYAFVCRADQGGIMQAVSVQEATEYAFGGEYDEVLAQQGEDDFVEDGYWDWLKKERGY